MARDDSNQAALDTLAKRVGMKCSNPQCGRLTAGPRTETTATVNIGVGAHITAASPGGPRFNPNLSPFERSSVSNGIWLCQTCAKLIDNNQLRYTQDVLLRWKAHAEDSARAEIESAGTSLDSVNAAEQRSHRRHLIESWREALEKEEYNLVDYQSTFLSSSMYSNLRAYLTADVIQMVEAPRTVYVGGARGDDVRKYTLLDQVTRIERAWGLV